jgi:hypothetical protein
MTTTDSNNPAACPCLGHGPAAQDIIEERDIGTDKTDGRYADVTLTRCARCHRLWLKYFVEYEAFSQSGRWCQTVISYEDAEKMTPERAPAYLATAPWHIYGGSYFNNTRHRGSGALYWGT